jgi:hypothetical protein
MRPRGDGGDPLTFLGAVSQAPNPPPRRDVEDRIFRLLAYRYVWRYGGGGAGDRGLTMVEVDMTEVGEHPLCDLLSQNYLLNQKPKG